jgi:hypothetical protein
MSLNTNVPLSSMTGARQTMLSWAKVLDSFAEVPEVYRDSCKAILGDADPFPHLVLTPAVRGTRHKATEKLLCEVNDVFHIWECAGSQVVSTAYPLKAICSIEVGNILLYSWLTISGLTTEGIKSSYIIPFNAATGRHLAHFINKMRPAPGNPDEITWQAEQAKFDYLLVDNYKFMNYARESLVLGEKVVNSIWQPQIRRPLFVIFGRPILRTAALTHLAVLTDKEVIFIQDVKHSIKDTGGRYGGIWQYVPLRHILAVSLSDRPDGTVTLSLSLDNRDQPLDKLFLASNKPALEHFQRELSGKLDRSR